VDKVGSYFNNVRNGVNSCGAANYCILGGGGVSKLPSTITYDPK